MLVRAQPATDLAIATRILARAGALAPDGRITQRLGDVFYIGGWNEGIVYRVAGPSHPTPGETLSQCSPADGSISGLAWNGSFGMLPTPSRCWTQKVSKRRNAPSTASARNTRHTASERAHMRRKRASAGRSLPLTHLGQTWPA